MRLNRFALLVAGTAVFISGCASGRSLSTPLSAGTQTSGAVSTDSEYDSDPPEGTPPGRIAIQPQPAPPARGVSHFKSVSFLKAFGHHSKGCAEDGCADDACADDTCADDTCADDECAVAATSSCMVPDCAAPAAECTPENSCGEADCCDRSRFGFPRWPWNKHNQDDCAVEDGCVVPQESDCPADSVCGEPGCANQRRGWRMFCPCPKPACVKETKCGESCCEPPVSADCCESEGCNAQGDCPRGRFFCLLDKLRHGTLCGDRGTCGDYCASQQPGCGDEECGDEGCSSESAANHCRPASPLADRLQDPFVDNGNGDAAPDVPPGAVPQAPVDTDGGTAPEAAQPGQVPDAPPAPQPVNERLPRELNPVPGTAVGQTIIEPRIWPRLNEGRMVDQRSRYVTHPTGWHRD